MRLIWLSALSVLAIAGAVFAGPGLAGAQGQDRVKVEASPDGKTLNLYSADNADVRVCLRRIFATIGISYSVAPEVQGTVTLDLHNIRFEDALQDTLKQVDATYRVEGGVYQIVRKISFQSDPSDQSPKFHKPVRIEVGPNLQTLRVISIDQANVREVFDWLFNATGAHYTLTSDIEGTITMEARNIAFDAALQNICRQIDATYRFEGGTYRIMSRKGTPPKEPTAPGALRLILDAPGQSFEASLRRVMESGLNYRIDGGNYFAIDSSGQPIAQIVSASPQDASSAPPVVTQDGGYLYILRGDSLIKVSKKDLKVVARGTVSN